MYSDTLGFAKTDPARWRLISDEIGATRWEYVENKDQEQSFYVKYALGNVTEEEAQKVMTHVNRGLDADNSMQGPAEEAYATLLRGARFFSLLQEPCGIFPMQYKGPMFMTIGYIVASYVSGTEIAEPIRIELIRYLVNTAHPVDGGWGLHEVDKSTCFGTVMNYVALRLLGVPPSNQVCVKARRTLLSFGGALQCPHWGKAWLAVLNLFKWDGVNPAPPELWLMPYKGNPVHPGKWWVHTRAIYLPFSHLYLTQFQGPETELIREIRTEIYVEEYSSIAFSKHRNDVCSVDLYYPHTRVLDAMNALMVMYNKWVRPRWLARYAEQRVYDLIGREVQNTAGLCIAPVSYAFNACVELSQHGSGSGLFRQFMAGFQQVLFLGKQGMCVMGTNGGQVWDVSFALQCLVVSGLADLDEFEQVVLGCFGFLVRSQFTTDCVEGSYRDKRRGAFPYSTKSQGYTVSDCTAEAIKAIVMVTQHPKYRRKAQPLVDESLLFAGIDVLLSLQNLGSFHYGSFATYETIRATPLLEKINPAEVFGNIMVEYPYVECTDSAVLGLTYFTQHYAYRRADVAAAIDRAVQYIRKAQNGDGSWYGCWGVCFTYAAMFALEAFHSVGLTYSNDPAVQKGCDFLVSRQLQDGGWGESMKSCETHTYVDSDAGSLVVQTAWAVLALLYAEYPHIPTIEKGIRFLVLQQLPNGEWSSNGVEGVFNHSCAIEYPNYKFIFPCKALGLYIKLINSRKNS